MRAVLSLLVFLALTPATASAVSIQEIVALSNSGVSDEVILTLIERDNTIFTIDPDQLVALQRQGVPSRFINFPDEGHWVLKPKNSEFWHKEVFAWLKKYMPPGGK